jgi:hypothetical protein
MVAVSRKSQIKQVNYPESLYAGMQYAPERSAEVVLPVAGRFPGQGEPVP